MSGYCPAGRVNCERFIRIVESPSADHIGHCYARGGEVRRIFDTDTKCPCPKLQRVVEGKFERAWDNFLEEIEDREISFADTLFKEWFMKALKEAGFKDE